MGYSFYITPEEYEIAEKNGIDHKLVDDRVRKLAWKIDKAISTPVRQQLKYSKHWREVAKNKGIPYRTFVSRIGRGWSEEEAATRPRQTLEEKKIMAVKASEFNRVYPEKYRHIAEKNGISYELFRNRVNRYKWSMERAATEPVWTASQRGRAGAQALRDREGDWAALTFRKRPRIARESKIL